MKMITQIGASGRDMKAVCMEDFVKAMSKVQKSVSLCDIEKYVNWMAEFESS